MEVGLLTAPFTKESLEQVVDFASKAGFDALEVVGTHIDPTKLSSRRAKEITALLGEKGVRISSLAAYINTTDADPKKRKDGVEYLKSAVDAAVMLGVEVICTMAGMPVPGKTKIQTIEEDVPEALGPVVEHAAQKGVKVALENWYATNLQGLAHFDKVFEVLPAANFGLNFDPSHLCWQDIDYIEAVYRFKDRIFHTHAKDTEVRKHDLRYLGNQADGWWRYCIPGFGIIHWGQYIAALKHAGYDGVLSIEHEDGALGREEGFLKGLAHLRQFA